MGQTRVVNLKKKVVRVESTVILKAKTLPFQNWQAATDLTLRRLMSYIYGAPILDVSRSHTTTQHSR